MTTTWTAASATAMPSTGPWRGRNCGKNENANTAAFGFGGDGDQRGPERRRWRASRREAQLERLSELALLPARATPCGHAQVDQDSRADHVHAGEQDRVGAHQRRQPRAGYKRPAEHADLVACHGGQPGLPAIADRPMHEQRRRRPGQRGHPHAGEQERGENRSEMPHNSMLVTRPTPGIWRESERAIQIVGGQLGNCTRFTLMPQGSLIAGAASNRDSGDYRSSSGGGPHGAASRPSRCSLRLPGLLWYCCGMSSGGTRSPLLRRAAVIPTNRRGPGPVSIQHRSVVSMSACGCATVTMTSS